MLILANIVSKIIVFRRIGLTQLNSYLIKIKYESLVYRHWSGKHKAVVSGINLITLLWTDGERCVPIDYRIFDKDRDGKTKNDHFAEICWLPSSAVLIRNWYVLTVGMARLRISSWCALWAGIS